MNVASLSRQFSARRLFESDVGDILSLCEGNPQYYRFCPPFVTKESVLKDMSALPPRTTYDDKYYIGFFGDEKLVAVMDLILNYPNGKTAFVGFFMLDSEEQGKGLGSKIVSECFDGLKRLGYEYVRLGSSKGNPQSEGFWRKNGFLPTGVEYDGGGYKVVVMERKIS